MTKVNSNDNSRHPILQKLREQLEGVDQEVIALLAKRMQLVEEIGQYKVEQKLDIVDPLREKEIQALWLRTAKQHGLKQEPIQRVFHEVLLYSREIQESPPQLPKDE